MALNLRTPGVYIEEVTRFPPSVVPVETAIPVFIGYTERTNSGGIDLLNRPVEIDSFLEFEQIFGQPPAIGGFTVALDPDGKVLAAVTDPNRGTSARFRCANAVRHFYDNGGGRCYVVSIGDYAASGVTANVVNAHLAGLAATAREDEPTLIVLPDLSALVPASQSAADIAAVRASYHSVLTQALEQCATLGDRFLICEVWGGDQPGSAGIDAFRDGIGNRNLKYGAVYHPFLHTTLPWRWNEATITMSQLASRNADGTLARPGALNGRTLAQLVADGATVAYANVRQELDRYSVILPPGAAVAGVYATVDRTRGVWKSPANESLASVRALTVDIDNDLNDQMNVHPSGKSINALRFFTGKGRLVWGARTLAGNDNEWRYVAVRRFFNMVEESTRRASEPFVFEPNDANTWIRVKTMIENFLLVQWRQGALAGAKPEDAFYVRVGLGETMTAQDILEGRMHVEIGMAVVRPAEFIVLRFSHKMQEA
jgi:Bacteriophage tail sheath protein